MTAIRTKIILILLTALLSLGGILAAAAQGSEGGGMSRTGTLPVLIGGGPSGISRGATGVHSIPFGDRNGIRNRINIEEWQAHAVNVIDVAETLETYPGDFWTKPDFVSRVGELDSKRRKNYVEGMSEFVILLMLEQPHESNLQHILRIVKLAATLQFLEITGEK